MKADSHVHLFENGFFGAPGSQVGVVDYERLRGIGDIDEALVLGYEGDVRYRGNNAYIQKVAETRPWVRPLYYLDARVAPHPDELALAGEQGYLGFALYLDEGNPALEGWPAAAVSGLGRNGSIVSINAGPESLEKAREWISAMTSCSVLISHLGLPGPLVQGHPDLVRDRLAPLRALQDVPDVSVKLSGLYAIDPLYPYREAAPYVEEVVQVFGSRRLQWGSDFSPAMGYGSAEQVAGLPDWVHAQFSPDERDDVAGRNLRRALARAADGSDDDENR